MYVKRTMNVYVHWFIVLLTMLTYKFTNLPVTLHHALLYITSLNITESRHKAQRLKSDVIGRVANPPRMGRRLPEFKSISCPEMLISRNAGVRNAPKFALFDLCSYNTINSP